MTPATVGPIPPESCACQRALESRNAWRVPYFAAVTRSGTMDCRPTICGVLPGVGYFAGYMQTPIWNRVINCDVLARTLLFLRKRRLVAVRRRAIMEFAFLVRMPLLKL